MKHKYAEVIHAWADGAEIEYKGLDNVWYRAEARDFDNNFPLRIKPQKITMYVYSNHPEGVSYFSATKYPDEYINSSTCDYLGSVEMQK